MIPIRDNQPIRRFPLINWLLITANIIIFLFELSLGINGSEGFIYKFGMIPSQLLSNIPGNWTTIFTSMFLHGGWLHLISNLLALYIFGDNIEDRLGHTRYLFFYLVGGAAAGIVHVLVYPYSTLPTIGASGAIAAVLGAYMILFPRARVVTIIPIFFFIQIVQIPALLYLGFWFLSQLLNGTTQVAANTFQSGGVAWWAHIGGFIAGILLILFISLPKKPKKETVWDHPEVIIHENGDGEDYQRPRWHSTG